MHLKRGESRNLDEQNAQKTGGFAGGGQSNVVHSNSNDYSDNTIVPQFGSSVDQT